MKLNKQTRNIDAKTILASHDVASDEVTTTFSGSWNEAILAPKEVFPLFQ